MLSIEIFSRESNTKYEDWWNEWWEVTYTWAHHNHICLNNFASLHLRRRGIIMFLNIQLIYEQLAWIREVKMYLPFQQLSERWLRSAIKYCSHWRSVGVSSLSIHSSQSSKEKCTAHCHWYRLIAWGLNWICQQWQWWSTHIYSPPPAWGAAWWNDNWYIWRNTPLNVCMVLWNCCWFPNLTNMSHNFLDDWLKCWKDRGYICSSFEGGSLPSSPSIVNISDGLVNICDAAFSSISMAPLFSSSLYRGWHMAILFSAASKSSTSSWMAEKSSIFK